MHAAQWTHLQLSMCGRVVLGPIHTNDIVMAALAIFFWRYFNVSLSDVSSVLFHVYRMIGRANILVWPSLAFVFLLFFTFFVAVCFNSCVLWDDMWYRIPIVSMTKSHQAKLSIFAMMHLWVQTGLCTSLLDIESLTVLCSVLSFVMLTCHRSCILYKTTVIMIVICHYVSHC
jgi:hypothetical protein